MKIYSEDIVKILKDLYLGIELYGEDFAIFWDVNGGSGHLVVLIGFDKEGFIANDPDDLERPGQKIKLSSKNFNSVWTRRAIFIHQI